MWQNSLIRLFLDLIFILANFTFSLALNYYDNELLYCNCIREDDLFGLNNSCSNSSKIGLRNKEEEINQGWSSVFLLFFSLQTKQLSTKQDQDWRIDFFVVNLKKK